jgi:DNA-binding transcriptional ArsR family regulator
MLAAKPMNLNAVAENFDISRPAVSKHIRILTECGLVVIRQQGRERFCHAELQALKQVNEWTDQYRTFWNKKLDALGAFLEKEEQATRKKKK